MLRIVSMVRIFPLVKCIWSVLLTIFAEKLDKRNYIEGIKLLGAYLHYVAEEPQVEQ